MLATSAKSRDQPSLTKLMKVHDAALKDIAKVDNYIRNSEADDDVEDAMSDDIDGDRISDSSVEQLFKSITTNTDAAAGRGLKKLFSVLTPSDPTLASATVGVK